MRKFVTTTMAAAVSCNEALNNVIAALAVAFSVWKYRIFVSCSIFAGNTSSACNRHITAKPPTPSRGGFNVRNTRFNWPKVNRLAVHHMYVKTRGKAVCTGYWIIAMGARRRRKTNGIVTSG